MRLLLFASLFLFTITSFSQFMSDPEMRKVTVKGKVLEEGTNVPLEYATVSFLSKDGAVAGGGLFRLWGETLTKNAKGRHRTGGRQRCFW